MQIVTWKKGASTAGLYSHAPALRLQCNPSYPATYPGELLSTDSLKEPLFPCSGSSVPAHILQASGLLHLFQQSFLQLIPLLTALRSSQN